MSDVLRSGEELGAAAASRASDEDVLDDIVAECVEAGGERLAERVESACGANPRLASAIRRRIESLREVGLLRDDTLPADDRFPERLGEFRLLERLGGGGMGVVFRARQESLGRDVALKLIRPEHLYFPRARERFQRETEAVARLQHPGIVPIYAVGSQSGVPYFAMELLPACTLAAAIDTLRSAAPERLNGADLQAALQRAAPAWSRGAKPASTVVFAGSYVEAVVRLVIQVAEALEHAHARQVLHRDVKPSNIAATLDGRALLFDFGLAGLATQERRLTVTSNEIGSLHYMAPEHLRGESSGAGVAADVYSLGVTLYELLALQLPFEGQDLLETRAAILEGRCDSLRARNRAVPRDLETVCAKAMEVQAVRRYASTAEFAEDLRNVLEHHPIRARPPSAARVATHWIRRHRATSAFIAAGSMCAIGIPLASSLRTSALNRELTSALAEAREQRTLAQFASVEADAQRDRARQDARNLRDINRVLVEVFSVADNQGARGGDLTARELLDDGVQRFEAELEYQPSVRAAVLSSIGQSYLSLREWDRAEELIQRALDLSRATDGEESLAFAEHLRALADLEQQRGLGIAFEHASRALEIQRRLQAERDVGFIHTLVTFVMAATQAERFDQAEAACHEALMVCAELPGEQREMRAVVYANLANLQLMMHAPEAALESARESLERMRSVPVSRHDVTLSAMNAMALALVELERYDEARPILDELLEREQPGTGQSTDGYASSLISKANLEFKTGRYDAAVEYVERAREAAEGTDTPTSENALYRPHLLGMAHIRAGRWREALAAYRERLPFAESAFGPSAWTVLMNHVWLALCHEALGEWSAAEDELVPALERAADAGEEQDDRWEAIAAAQLARYLARRGELGAANELVARARSLEEDCQLETPPQCWIRLASGVVAEAAGEVERASAELEPLAAHEHGPLYAEAVPAIARARLAVLRASSDPAKAKELVGRAREELERELGPGHPETRALVGWLESQP